MDDQDRDRVLAWTKVCGHAAVSAKSGFSSYFGHCGRKLVTTLQNWDTNMAKTVSSAGKINIKSIQIQIWVTANNEVYMVVYVKEVIVSSCKESEAYWYCKIQNRSMKYSWNNLRYLYSKKKTFASAHLLIAWKSSFREKSAWWYCTYYLSLRITHQFFTLHLLSRNEYSCGFCLYKFQLPRQLFVCYSNWTNHSKEDVVVESIAYFAGLDLSDFRKGSTN